MVCQGQLLCKVSPSQLSLMSRKPNFDVKNFKVSGLKYRSRSAGQGACLKDMSRTITMQGFRLAAITDVKLRLKIFKDSGP